MYLEKEIQVYAMDALTTWLSQLQPWEVLALYGLGAVIFGTANKRLLCSTVLSRATPVSGLRMGRQPQRIHDDKEVAP